MQEWEYKVVDLETRAPEEDPEEDERDAAVSFEEFLNEMGQHGWELVGVMEMQPFLIFKKPKPFPPRP